MQMFCFQCEQTTKGSCCAKIGTCGKKPDLARLQDELIGAVIAYAGASDVNEQSAAFIEKALFYHAHKRQFRQSVHSCPDKNCQRRGSSERGF